MAGPSRSPKSPECLPHPTLYTRAPAILPRARLRGAGGFAAFLSAGCSMASGRWGDLFPLMPCRGSRNLLRQTAKKRRPTSRVDWGVNITRPASWSGARFRGPCLFGHKKRGSGRPPHRPRAAMAFSQSSPILAVHRSGYFFRPPPPPVAPRGGFSGSWRPLAWR